MIEVRRAEPSDAAGLVGADGGGRREPGGWLLHDRREAGAWSTSGGTCGPSVDTPTRAVFVAEVDEAGSSGGSRSRATRTPRAATSPTSG